MTESPSPADLQRASVSPEDFLELKRQERFFRDTAEYVVRLYARLYRLPGAKYFTWGRWPVAGDLEIAYTWDCDGRQEEDTIPIPVEVFRGDAVKIMAHLIGLGKLSAQIERRSRGEVVRWK